MQFKHPLGAHRDAGIPVMGREWRDEHFADEHLAGVIFQDCVFEAVQFERGSFEQTIFIQCRLVDCTFRDARLVHTRLVGCEGTGITVTGGEIQDMAISDSRLGTLDIRQQALRLVLAESAVEHLSFSDAGTHQDTMTISGCDFGQVDAENVVWHGVSAVDVDLRVWTMPNAELNRCCFIRSKGDDADLSAVHFNTCNLYQSTFRRARLRHGEGSIFAECDLEETDFVEASLEGALFAKSQGPKARFDRARIERAIFADAALTEASFAGALATQSVWTDADLTGANLENVSAFRGIFRNAKLKDANVLGANLTETDLHGVAEVLDGADTHDARGTVDWRAERESTLQAEAGA